MTRPRFKNEDFEFGYEIALGGVYRGFADAGEVQATAGRVKDGDADAWVREWSETAEALRAQAEQAEAGGRHVSARGLYLRAGSYYSTALYLITQSQQTRRRQEIWLRHRACWDKAVDLASVPAKRIQITYEDTSLLAFEHRFAAAVVDPGVVDVSTTWTAQLPGFMESQLQDASKKKAFDQEMGWTERFSKSTRATLHFRGEPYGLESNSRWELYQEVMKYKLGAEVKDITTPVLVTSPEDEQFWTGQSQQLYDMLPGDKQLVELTAVEGANRHCEPMGLGIRDARIYDWLDSYLRP
jgi:hypothetical protein